MLRVEMLPARHGDCLWVEYGEDERRRRILVDGGPWYAYPALKRRIERLPAHDRRFELVIVTHIDADHIGGILEFLGDSSLDVEIGDVWFNGRQHMSGDMDDALGPVQGERLSELLARRRLPWNAAFGGLAVAIPESMQLPRKTIGGGLALTLLSPILGDLRKLRSTWEAEVRRAGLLEGTRDPEPDDELDAPRPPADMLGDDVVDIGQLAATPYVPDASITNGSSIAVLAEFASRSCLLASDASPLVLERAAMKLRSDRRMNRLMIDALKVPHHGGSHNMTVELLREIQCQIYFISTNGRIYYHPNRDVIAKIIDDSPIRASLVFNYRTHQNEVWNQISLKQKYRYDVRFPDEGGEGISVSL